MNEELVSALKIALSHGSSLDDAINSFISAGYSSSEVREAAQSLQGITPHLAQQPPVTEAKAVKKEVAPAPAQPPKPLPQPLPQSNPLPQTLPVQKPAQTANQEEHSGWVKWIVAYLIVFVLIIIIGLGILIFKPDLFSGLFGTNSWP